MTAPVAAVPAPEAGPGANGHDGGAYPGGGPAAPRPGPGHDSGGQRLALPGASAAARGLARAALALDEQRISETIRAALIRDGSVRTWEELLVPVLSGLGTRFEHTGTCVEAEHLLSVVVIAEFSRRTADLPGQVQHRAVLLASAEGEQHSLPLHALAAALAERGSTAGSSALTCPTCAGGRRPAHRPGRGLPLVPGAGHRDPAMLPDLFPRRPGARLILGGPGWDRDRVPAAARLVGTLPDARSEVVAALGY